MKKILIIMISLLILPSAISTNWYVDNAVASSGNGQSWNTAWKAFSNINWASVQPGDTIYISGGSNQKIYYEGISVGKSGTINAYIKITKGTDSEHNGRVIINGQQNTLQNGVDFSQDAYVIVSNLEITQTTRGVWIHGSSHDIIVDSMKIYDYYDHAGIAANGWTSNNRFGVENITLRNNYVRGDLQVTGQTDNTYFLGVDNLLIENNTFIVNNSIVEGYSDNIQTQNVGNAIIRNNILINYIGNGDQGIIGNFANNALTNSISRVEIYNNVIIFPNTAPLGARAILIRYYDWYISSGLPDIYIYGNSIYANDGVSGIALQLPATVKNNIIYATNGMVFGNDNMGYNMSVNRVSNNLIYRSGGYSNNGIEGTWNGNGLTIARPTYNQWVNTLGGTPFITSNPDYVNPNNLDLTLQSNSPAIDAGVALSVPYNVAIDGVSRPQGAAWDIGAYEYMSGSTTFHPADTSQNGCIELNEISAYVNLWLQGSVSLTDVSEAVNIWIGGC